MYNINDDVIATGAESNPSFLSGVLIEHCDFVVTVYHKDSPV